MAAVFWASFRRRAMAWRRRVIFTRSSRSSSGRGGSGPDGAAAPPAGAALNERFAVPASIAFCTSSLTRRPSLPVGLILVGSRLFSSTSLRTAGDMVFRSWLPEDAAAAGAGLAASFFGSSFLGSSLGASAFAASFFGSSFFGAAVALSSIEPSSAPTSTSAPSLARISVRTPEAGALTSSVTLSVSSSTNGSSAATASPGAFIHFATVASETDSPSVGTLISVAIPLVLFICRHAAADPPGCPPCCVIYGVSVSTCPGFTRQPCVPCLPCPR